MAVKLIFWSCLALVAGYFAYRELTFITLEYSLKKFIPAKRSDVFELLLDNPEFYEKVHPLCTGVSNVIRSQDEEGYRTVQMDIQEAIVIFGLYNKTIRFQVTAKGLEENAVIQNTANVGGYFQINQRWHLSDSKNGSEDGTLLEDHFKFTTPLFIARFSKVTAQAAHTDLLEKIKEYFKNTSAAHKYDNSG